MDGTAVQSHRQSRSTRTAIAALLAAAVTCLLMLVTLIAPLRAYAAENPGLGTAGGFAVLAGSTVTNTGPSIVNNDTGVSPGSAIVGFPPGILTDGTFHAADGVAAQAQADLTVAYNQAAGQSVTATVGPELGGLTLVPGVYGSGGGTLQITGPLTLNAEGDPNAVFVFQSASTLITASASSVNLINGAQACNVFWQVGSSATLGTGSAFVGTIMALTSITAQTGATIAGRTLARNGAVTLDTNVFTSAQCAAPSESPTDTTSPTGSTSPTDSTSPTGSASATDSTSPSTSTSPTETVSQSATETVSQSATETVSQSATETVSESATETISESATETVSESATETSTATQTSGVISESATEAATATSTATGNTLARTGSSQLITIVGIGGALLLLGGGTLLVIKARTRTRGRHSL